MTKKLVIRDTNTEFEAPHKGKTVRTWGLHNGEYVLSPFPARGAYAVWSSSDPDEAAAALRKEGHGRWPVEVVEGD